MTTITPGEVFPIDTATTGTISQTTMANAANYSGTFIPTLWSGKLNVKFYETTVFGEIANTNYEGDVKNLGDKVIINNIPSITINNYEVGNNLSYQVPTPNTVELTVDKAKYFGVNVSDVLAYQAQPNLMDMFTSDAAKQMAITIDRETLLAQYNTGAAANKGATAGALSGAYNLGTDAAPVVLTAANVVETLMAMGSVLDEQNVPETDRWLVISPYVRNILMKSDLKYAYLTGDGTSPLRNGKIGTIDRYTLYISNLLPKAAADTAMDGTASAGTAKRQVILAGHKSAMTWVSQIAKTETLQNPSDFGQLVRGLNVFGYKTIKPEALTMALVA